MRVSSGSIKEPLLTKDAADKIEIITKLVKENVDLKAVEAL